MVSIRSQHLPLLQAGTLSCSRWVYCRHTLLCLILLWCMLDPFWHLTTVTNRDMYSKNSKECVISKCNTVYISVYNSLFLFVFLSYFCISRVSLLIFPLMVYFKETCCRLSMSGPNFPLFFLWKICNVYLVGGRIRYFPPVWKLIGNFCLSLI